MLKREKRCICLLINKLIFGNDLIKDAKKSTEVKSFHIVKRTEILKEYGLKK